MMNFIVNDMTCGHCESVVTRAIKTVDPDAVISVDLGKHQVSVESDLDVNSITDAMNEAGYPATVSNCCVS